MRIILILIFWAVAYPSYALVILQYHHISDSTPKSTSTSPKVFERHLQLIEREGYEVVSIEHVAKALRGGKALHEKTVVISFDDGYESIYSHALPMLKKRNWPFVVFVNTEPHDQKLLSHMSWAQLKEMQKWGATIANHGVTHRHLLRRNSNESAKAIVKSEILAAEARIDEKTGQNLKLFAYPFGEYDQDIADELEKHGYIAFGQHSGAVASDVNLQRVPRFPFGGPYGSEEDFVTKLRTLPIEGLTSNVLAENKKQISDPLLPNTVSKPIWQLQLPVGKEALSLNCFASGQGAISVKRNLNLVEVQANKALPAGRSKYNCTASAGGGRFYWISKLWIRKTDSGGWKPE